MQAVSVDVNQMARQTGLMIKVKGSRQLAVRVRLAAALMALAGRIAGPLTEVVVEFTSPGDQASS